MANIEQVYEEEYKLSPAQKSKFKKNELTEFPVAATVILHLITFGIFTWIYFGLIHEKLPKVKDDDFGAAKAILFMLIPFFNIYWMFIFWLRLYDRVNLQLKARGRSFELPRGLVIATLILNLIPFVNYITFIFWPIVAGLMQSGINQAAK